MIILFLIQLECVNRCRDVHINNGRKWGRYYNDATSFWHLCSLPMLKFRYGIHLFDLWGCYKLIANIKNDNQFWVGDGKSWYGFGTYLNWNVLGVILISFVVVILVTGTSRDHSSRPSTYILVKKSLVL